MADHLDRFLDSLDLETDREDIHLDKQQIRQLASIRRLIRREGDRIVALIDDVQAAVAQTGADATAAGERVIAAIATTVAAASAQIADLQAQVQALIDGNASDVTPEALQAVLDGVTAVDTTVKGIAPDATPAP